MAFDAHFFTPTGAVFRQLRCDFVFCDCLPLCASHSVGRPKHVRVMAGALEGDLFIGPKAEVTNTHSFFLFVSRGTIS